MFIDETPGNRLGTDAGSYAQLSYDGDSEAHFYASNGALKELISIHKTGSLVNLVNKQGYTPLDCARIMGHKEVVEYLEEHLKTERRSTMTDFYKQALVLSCIFIFTGALGLIYWYFFIKESPVDHHQDPNPEEDCEPDQLFLHEKDQTP